MLCVLGACVITCGCWRPEVQSRAAWCTWRTATTTKSMWALVSSVPREPAIAALYPTHPPGCSALPLLPHAPPLPLTMPVPYLTPSPPFPSVSSHPQKALNPDTNEVVTIAGSGVAGLRDGVGTEAQFSEPAGLALGPDGVLIIADTNNNAIRLLDPKTKKVTTLGLSGVPEPRVDPLTAIAAGAVTAAAPPAGFQLVRAQQPLVVGGSGSPTVTFTIALPANYHLTKGAGSSYYTQVGSGCGAGMGCKESLTASRTRRCALWGLEGRSAGEWCAGNAGHRRPFAAGAGRGGMGLGREYKRTHQAVCHCTCQRIYRRRIASAQVASAVADWAQPRLDRTASMDPWVTGSTNHPRTPLAPEP